MRRFFAAKAKDGSGRLAVEGEDARHIGTVLRMKPGDMLDVVLPDGTPARCTIEYLGDGSVMLENFECSGAGTETNKEYVLLQCLPKGQKMDYIVEKCTELGFSTFVPVVAERCIARDASDSKLTRWRKLAHEAAQQSGRMKAPVVEEVTELGKALEAALKRGALILMFWEEERSKSLRDIEESIRKAGEICLVIGPEGGISPKEAEHARSLGALTISLGPRILRTETAPVAAGAAVMYIAGELDACEV